MVVPMLALRITDRPGVRLVWFYGTVTGLTYRPAAPGLRTVASLDTSTNPGSSCVGTGITEDVFWTPKTPGAQSLNVKGFYVIGVEMSAECQDKVVLFTLSGAGGASSQGTIAPQEAPVNTPPYGLANRRNLVFRSNQD
jgi:hypothetical protein